MATAGQLGTAVSEWALTVEEAMPLVTHTSVAQTPVASPRRRASSLGQRPAGFGRNFREPVQIAVGREYRVEPLNPQKLKHRGRTCRITELDDDFMPDTATVSFTDGKPGRWGKVNVSDLVPVM